MSFYPLITIDIGSLKNSITYTVIHTIHKNLPSMTSVMVTILPLDVMSDGSLSIVGSGQCLQNVSGGINADGNDVV